jgi:FkbM family methyltransferase
VKRVVAFVPPRAARRIRFEAPRERLLWWIQASLERWPRRFETTTPQGFRFKGSTQDIIQRFVHVYGVWEPEATEWVRGRLRPGDAAVDVGANAGYFTLLFAQCVGASGRVVAVEAVPSIFAQLQENVQLNRATNVEAYLAAAGEEGGEVEIFRSDPANLGWSGSIPSRGSVSEGLVPRRRVADLVDEDFAGRLALVKIDTEGDELRTLHGMIGLLDRAGDMAILLELTPDKLAARGQSAGAVLELLAGHGFEPHRLAEGRRLVPLDGVPDEQVDVVFLRGGSAA